jgi:adenylylsulfate reductase subunit A
MTTVKGLFAAGDASGASSHKFSSGSFTEGRIAAKAAIAFCVDHPDPVEIHRARNTSPLMKEKVLKPLKVFEEHRAYTNDDGCKSQLHKAQDVYVPPAKDHG